MHLVFSKTFSALAEAGCSENYSGDGSVSLDASLHSGYLCSISIQEVKSTLRIWLPYTSGRLHSLCSKWHKTEVFEFIFKDVAKILDKELA